MNGVVDALDACDEERGYSSLLRLCVAMARPGLKGFARGFRGLAEGRGDSAGANVGSALTWGTRVAAVSRIGERSWAAALRWVCCSGSESLGILEGGWATWLGPGAQVGASIRVPS
jgi:hypothetical protein